MAKEVQQRFRSGFLLPVANFVVAAVLLFAIMIIISVGAELFNIGGWAVAGLLLTAALVGGTLLFIYDRIVLGGPSPDGLPKMLKVVVGLIGLIGMKLAFNTTGAVLVWIGLSDGWAMAGSILAGFVGVALVAYGYQLVFIEDETIDRIRKPASPV